MFHHAGGMCLMSLVHLVAVFNAAFLHACVGCER